MAHAGTMVGGSAQTKQSGRPWPAIALAVAVVVATVAGVWLASSAGLVGGTAKPAADRSYDQIEAQRGAIMQLGDLSLANDQRLNAILDKAHAAPYTGDAAALSSDAYLNGILDKAHATPYVDAAVSIDRILANDENGKFFDRAHAAPSVGVAAAPPLSATSGTFHPGKPADQPATRDRVGGP